MAINFLKKFGKKEEKGEKLPPSSSQQSKSAVPSMPVSHANEGKFLVQAESILRRLVMTSKAGKIGEYEKYIFEVGVAANKIDIKKAFTVLYGVPPLHVRTSILKPKAVRFGQRKGTRKKWKKATITIPANKSVTIV